MFRRAGFQDVDAHLSGAGVVGCADARENEIRFLSTGTARLRRLDALPATLERDAPLGKLASQFTTLTHSALLTAGQKAHAGEIVLACVKMAFCQWFWFDDGEWMPYDRAVHDHIEAAFSKHTKGGGTPCALLSLMFGVVILYTLYEHYSYYSARNKHALLLQLPFANQPSFVPGSVLVFQNKTPAYSHSNSNANSVKKLSSSLGFSHANFHALGHKDAD